MVQTNYKFATSGRWGRNGGLGDDERGGKGKMNLHTHTERERERERGRERGGDEVAPKVC